MTSTVADDLAELARQVQHLSPDWRNLEPFYERRSDIANRLRQSARALIGQPTQAPSTNRSTHR